MLEGRNVSLVYGNGRVTAREALPLLGTGTEREGGIRSAMRRAAQGCTDGGMEREERAVRQGQGQRPRRAAGWYVNGM